MANIQDTADISNFSTETPADEAVVATERPVLSVPGAAVGRRKQAIARVRLIPGSGTLTINGRAFEDYFPNKLHQQLVTDPFTLLGLEGGYDVIARIHDYMSTTMLLQRCLEHAFLSTSRMPPKFVVGKFPICSQLRHFP